MTTIGHHSGDYLSRGPIGTNFGISPPCFWLQSWRRALPPDIVKLSGVQVRVFFCMTIKFLVLVKSYISVRKTSQWGASHMQYAVLDASGAA